MKATTIQNLKLAVKDARISIRLNTVFHRDLKHAISGLTYPGEFDNAKREARYRKQIADNLLDKKILMARLYEALRDLRNGSGK